MSLSRLMRPPSARGARTFVLLRALSSAAADTAPPHFCSSSDGPLPFKVQSKLQMSPDSVLLTLGLPEGRRFLGEDVMLPTCLKVAFPNGTTESGEPTVLEKSYSPISHPSTKGTVDLLVKGYEPRPGGGVGAYLCGLEVGDSVMASLKSKRVMHGDANVYGRWSNIGLVAGGTGVAPLLQIARIALQTPPMHPAAKVHLLSINRYEEDILMRETLEAMSKEYGDRFSVTFVLTKPPDTWSGPTGRGDAALAQAALPPSTKDGKTMILVCGTDGFVAHWGGPIGRGPKKPDGSKGPKVQGPLLGVLAAAGFDESEVFKY